MASTYSDLKFELIGTGDQSGTWGSTTNDNIGTAIEQAIVGLGNPIFTTDANLTITLTNTVALQTARALVLNATSSGSLTATRELVVPTIEKQYIVQNNTSGGQSITVKTSAGTGITVPNGKKMHLYVDGVNVVDAVSHFSSLTLASALPVLSGGTGVTTSTGTTNVVLSNSPTLVTPALGTPSSAVLTNATGLPISTGVSGLGTNVATFLVTPSSANLLAAVTDETGTGDLVFATSPTLVTPALGTPSALVGTNITGTAAGLTAGNVTTNANLTGAVTSTGNATLLGSFSSANLAGALTDETGSGSAVFATSPTLVTPVLGVATATSLQGTIGNVTPAAATVTTLTASADSAFTSTGSLTVSKGTTGQRPGSPVSGMFRFNTTTAEFEGFNGTAFASVGGAALSNDTATASSLFPLFANATTGTASSVFTSNAQYLFKPSIGELSVKAVRASNGIFTNSATVSADATIASGDNGMSAGPVTINSGITVTVSSGSVYTVV